MERSHYDTYQEVKHLKETGLSEEQSVALVSTILSLIRFNVATKEDLAYVRDELNGNIAKVQEELKGDIAKVSDRVTRIEGQLNTLKAQIDGATETLTARFDGLSAQFRLLIFPIYLILFAALVDWLAKSAL